MENNIMSITNDRLRVDFVTPNTIYKRSRYDWAGIVKQVTLDNCNTFLGMENADKSKGLGGFGLIDVFETENNLEYISTPVGANFPMLGIGLLRKPDNLPFTFLNEYFVSQPFEIDYTLGKNKAAFVTYPIECKGYALIQKKEYTIVDNMLIVECCIENIGSKCINISTFNHNFFKFNDINVNESYHITFPYNVSPKVRRGEISLNYNSIKCVGFDRDSHTTSCELFGFEKLSKHSFIVNNEITKTSVSVRDNFRPSKVYNWISPHAICPEIFLSLHINPDKTYAWERTYQFE